MNIFNKQLKITIMKVREDLVNSYRAEQQQYNYYIIALAVACVGFSATTSSNQKITPIILPLGISVIAWFITIYCGIRLVNWRLSSTYANVELLDIQSGKSNITGNDPKYMDVGIKSLNGILDKNSNTMVRLSKCQIISFYVGIVFFVVWKIFVMLPNENQQIVNEWLSSFYS